MKTSLLLLVCAFFTFLPLSKSFCQSHEKAFDSLLKAQFSVDGPGGVALVAQNGRIIYKKAFGLVDLELNIPMKVDNVFRIGSNTKQFTAAAILKLAEAGKLSIKDSITKFIKDYPTHGKLITIENLLTHTSGIKNYTGLSRFNQEIKRKDFTPKALVDFFKDEPMDFAPGQDYRYDNSGYVLLGYIIEIISGKSYAKYINENFFEPLKMKNSYYDNSSEIISNRAHGYKKGNVNYENTDFLSMTLPYSAGSLLTNVDDMFTWHEALISDKVLNRISLEKAQTSYHLPNGKLTGYGYGWEIGNVQGSTSIKHVGVVNGFVTYTTYLPAENIFVAIFSNCECTGDLDNPASMIAAILMNKPYQFNKIEVSANILETYQGVYKTPFDGEKIVSFQDGKLLYYNKGGKKAQLLPYKKDNFFIDHTLINLSFLRNSKDQITGFNLNNTGISISATITTEKISPIRIIKVTPETLEKYVGKYQFTSSFVFEVIKEGDKLYGIVGHDKKELFPFNTNMFFTKDIDATIIFKLGTNGNVFGLTKIQNSEMSAKRLNK